MVDELEHAVAVSQVMDYHCLSKHIVSDTPHLYGVRCEELASVHEAAASESNWVVSFVHDKHANQTLISVDDKIAAELVHVFLFQS